MQWKRIFLIVSALLVVAMGFSGCGSDSSTALPQAVVFTNGQNASVVIGQADFTSFAANQGGSVAANTIWLPHGNPYVNSNGVLYIGDYGNSRVLVFNSIPTVNNASADFAIGQPDLTTNTASNASATTLSGPQQVVGYRGKLLVADTLNHRVAIYNTVPTGSPGTINVIIGQADKSSKATACTNTSLNTPQTVAMANGKVVVADLINNRVLIWNSVPTSDNTPADVVLGQASFTSCNANRGGNVADNTLNRPTGVWYDGVHLIVADNNNNRVLIWNGVPTTNGQAADLVLGQPDFISNAVNNGGISTSTMSFPYGAYSNGTQLFVVDSVNCRILIWNMFPTTNGQAADNVLGQPDFMSNGFATTQGSLWNPWGIFLYKKQLIVNDSANNRYLIFNGQ